MVLDLRERTDGRPQYFHKVLKLNERWTRIQGSPFRICERATNTKGCRWNKFIVEATYACIFQVYIARVARPNGLHMYLDLAR
jgi:hypothetical protein